MNPIFILLVVMAAALLWFLLSFAFPWIGKLALKIGRDAKRNIEKTEDSLTSEYYEKHEFYKKTEDKNEG